MGTAPYLNPEAYAEATAKARAYLFATDADAAPATPGSGPDSGSSSGSDGSGSDGSGSDGFAGDGFAGDGFTPEGGPSGGFRRRNKVIRPVRPVRAGLLGVSVAVALGVIAVATGVVPGLENYRLGGGSHVTGGDRVQTAAAPSNSVSPQGGTSGSAGTGDTGGRTSGPAGGGTERTGSPSPSSSASASASRSPSPSKPAPHKPARSRSAAPEAAPSKTAALKPAPRTTAPKPSKSALPSRSARPPQPAPPRKPSSPPRPSASATSAVPKPEPTPSRTATKAPAPTSPPVTVSREAAVAAEVLKLVDDERAKAGCTPLAANSSLTGLAEAFSDDMAARGFFDHTDPDGRTPWDRAAKAGITDLGGENIARGQADAAAVTNAWMNSPGHRANILNCGFKTLGVGVHFGPGGPWWTADFGF
jgi:uncharacterized protein YkwD